MAGANESQLFALIRDAFSEAASPPDMAEPQQMSMQLETRSGKLELRVQNQSWERVEGWAESCANRLLQAHKKVCKEVQVVTDIQVLK